MEPMEKSSKNIGFTVIVASFIFKFILHFNQLHIKGFHQNDGMCQYPVYDVIYQDLTLPQKIYEKYKTIEELIKVLYLCRKNLLIQTQSHCLLFSAELKGKTKKNLHQQHQWLEIPLMQKQDGLIKLQTHISIKSKKHGIKKVQNPYSLPYIAVVRILTKFGQISNQGSGVIVGRTKIFTVAHNVYLRSYQIECQIKNIRVYVQTLQGSKQVKVKSFQFPNEYKTTNQTEKNNYDFAYIFLESNDVIQDFQILEQSWKKIENDTFFQVIGYSPELDQSFQNSNACYHLAGQKFIEVFERYATYDIKAAEGISGGPAVIYDLINKKWKIIGLHQGFHPFKFYSVIVLLTTCGKSPFQIINQLDSIYSNQNYKKIKQRNYKNRVKCFHSNSNLIPKIDSIQNIINQSKQKIFQMQKLSQKKLEENKFQQALQLLENCLVILFDFPGKQSNQYKIKLKLIEQIRHKQKAYQCEHSQKNIVKLSLEDDYIQIHSSIITKNSNIEEKFINSEQFSYEQSNFFDAESSQNSTILTESAIRSIEIAGTQLDSLGYKDYLQKKFDKALQSYEQAKKLFERGSKNCAKQYAITCSNIGSIQMLKKNYQRARFYYIQALCTMQKHKLTTDIYFKTTIQQNLKKNISELEPNVIIDQCQ